MGWQVESFQPLSLFSSLMTHFANSVLFGGIWRTELQNPKYVSHVARSLSECLFFSMMSLVDDPILRCSMWNECANVPMSYCRMLPLSIRPPSKDKTVRKPLVVALLAACVIVFAIGSLDQDFFKIATSSSPRFLLIDVELDPKPHGPRVRPQRPHVEPAAGALGAQPIGGTTVKHDGEPKVIAITHPNRISRPIFGNIEWMPKPQEVVATVLGMPALVMLGNVFASLQGPFTHNFVAGLVAAFCATSIMFPVDSAKTRVQAGKTPFPIAGIAHLYDGIAFAFLKDCPAAAVYITVYEVFKTAMLSVTGNSIDAATLFVILLIAGGIGDLFASVFALPMELILKQIQTGDSKSALQIFKHHGVHGIFTCWKTMLMRDIPMSALQLAFFESLKPWAPMLTEQYGMPHVCTMMFLGAVAGAAASILTAPCDTVNCRIMTYKKAGGGSMPSAWMMAQEIYDTEGITGLFRGCMWRILYFVPECCIFFAVFETAMELLH